MQAQSKVIPRISFLRKPAILLTGLLVLFLLSGYAWAQETGPKGRLLVAQPQLKDPNFRKSVVLITQHGKVGTVGVILNRPTKILLSKVFPQNEVLADSNKRLFGGGPVSGNTLVFLFRSDSPNKRALGVFGDVYLSADLKLLGRLLAKKGTRDIRIYAGFAGWAPGQLNKEIARGDWLFAQPTLDQVFTKSSDKLWQQLMQKLDGQLVDGKQQRVIQLSSSGLTN